MGSEKEWWEQMPMQLKHYKTRNGARKYALRTPGRWHIAICDDSIFVGDEKEDLGIWVVILESRYEWFKENGIDVENLYDVQETIQN